MKVLLIAALIAHGGYHADLSAAAGFPVRCQPLSAYGFGAGIGGTALLDSRVIVLAPDTCRGFRHRGVWRVESLMTLGHERAHLLGVTDEHEADCDGFRQIGWLARRLHLLVRRSWVRTYVTGSPVERCFRRTGRR